MRIYDLLSGQQSHAGLTTRNNRLFVDAMLRCHRKGIPRRYMHERFANTVEVLSLLTDLRIPPRYVHALEDTNALLKNNHVKRVIAEKASEACK